MGALSIPQNYPRIKMVKSFNELLSTSFEDGINALCWQRELEGDFSEVLGSLKPGKGITGLDAPTLRALPLSAPAKAAVDAMLKDLHRLQDANLDPVLECVDGYVRDAGPGPVFTDVYSFHADSATVQTDTFLCTYHGAASEGLRNDQAIRKIDIPHIRAALLAEFGGADDESFREYLSECCYDLHYAPAENAKPFSFGVGNLWRIAVAYPGSPVPPCIHRAPPAQPEDAVRILMIS
jgi:hypothetical protein